MEQHPVPRQITSFEFKLIGFMTLRQFLYLLVFIPMGLLLWKIIPIPLLNILFGVIVGISGVCFAFLPINDRPLDVWIKNLMRRLTSPTQYTFHKHNPPLYFLHDLFFISDPHKVMTHIESQKKLATYLAKTAPAQSTPSIPDTKHVDSLLKESSSTLQYKQEVVELSPPSKSPPVAPEIASAAPQPKRPFLIGVVKNNRRIPLPGVLIYVKDETNHAVRLLKTNPHGVFATYSPLKSGTYQFEVKDPKGSYFFDTMNINVGSTNLNPYEFYSKELL